MVRGGSGLCRTTQVRFIVLSLFMYISDSPIISVTGSVEKNNNDNNRITYLYTHIHTYTHNAILIAREITLVD